MLYKTAIGFLTLSLIVLLCICAKVKTESADNSTPQVSLASVAEVETPLYKYGFDLHRFKIENHAVGRNECFADILGRYNVSRRDIEILSRESKAVFNLNKIKAGNNFTVLFAKKGMGNRPLKLIYEENKVDYVVFNLADSLAVYRDANTVEHRHMEVSGIITSSLYETFEANNLDPSLAVRMAEIFAWTVDFYKIQAGDKFKVIYDADFVNNECVKMSDISACLFNSGGKDYYAVYYDKDNGRNGGYYDENGNSMKKQFLKAPVKFSKVTSPYSLNRFHPVTKEWKAHLGTDYGAPTGTPIMATADGIVEEACFKEYNGNYVKIRHNGQYKTQYLHMSKIGAGIHPGAKVKQGETIGYVGMTGLATGPHVCYRFWKDGAQVDPRKQKMTYSEPLPVNVKKDFLNKTKDIRDGLDAIAYAPVKVRKPKTEAQMPVMVMSDTTYDLLQRFTASF